jgi:hypothetical protein
MTSNKGGRPSHWKSTDVSRLIRVPEYMAEKILKIAHDIDDRQAEKFDNIGEIIFSKDNEFYDRIQEIINQEKSKPKLAKGTIELITQLEESLKIYTSA